MANAISRIGGLIEVKKWLISEKSKDLDNIKEESLLKSKLKRIDEEYALKIDVEKTTPINHDTEKAKAKSDLDSAKREHKRARINAINRAEDMIKDAELSLNNAKIEAENLIKKAEHNLEKVKRNLALVNEESLEIEEANNISATEFYQSRVSQIGNSEQMLKYRIKQLEQERERKKQELVAQLDSVLATKSVSTENFKEIEGLYSDLMAISKEWKA